LAFGFPATVGTELDFGLEVNGSQCLPDFTMGFDLTPQFTDKIQSCYALILLQLLSISLLCCRHWFLLFTGAVIAMSLSGDFFAVYMLYYGGWDWILGFGLLIIGFFTFVSAVIFNFSVLLSCIC
jgi:hypothetical protein